MGLFGVDAEERCIEVTDVLQFAISFGKTVQTWRNAEGLWFNWLLTGFGGSNNKTVG